VVSMAVWAGSRSARPRARPALLRFVFARLEHLITCKDRPGLFYGDRGVLSKGLTPLAGGALRPSGTTNTIARSELARSRVSG
jgi:hypothetical protein